GTAPDGTTLFTDVQGGSQLSEGFEVDLLFTPIDDLQVMLAFSRCDAIYEQYPSNPALDRAPLVATPDRTFSLWGKYFFRSGSLEGFAVAGGISHVGSASHVANNPLVRTPAYTTIDLTLGYRFELFGRKCSADLSVKNLVNERYYASASSWGFPRHVIFSLGARF
ncbi:MAG TPA: TonB-dependent receptor, partial [Opitutus sp.]|nr:TonB-dependent receptor [Opitutus sp.]